MKPPFDQLPPVPLEVISPQNPAIRLKLRSWGAFALVCGLLIVHQLLLQPALMRLNSDAPVINVAGRQRMLSQKLAKTALALQTAGDPQSRRARRGELLVIVNEWTRAQRGLQQGDASLNLPGENSPQVRAAFEELEPHFQAILKAAEDVLADDNLNHGLLPDQHAAIERILDHEDEFLGQMHALVSLYATEARNHVWQLQVLGWGIVTAILALLLAVQWLVIRPAVDLVRSRFASSEDQYRRLVESMSEGLIVHDVHGNITFANRRFCEIVGLNLEELLGKLASAFIADVDRARYTRLIDSSAIQSVPVELALRCSDGRLTETMASSQPLSDERGCRQGFLLVVTDITARKQAEQRTRELLEQLAHADRLKSMGELAAGLAHEINQPLAAIANYAEACLAGLPEDASAAEKLQVPLRRILAAALRGGEIIRRSRRFAQRRPHEVRPESLNDLARDVEQLCRPEALRRNVKVELILAPAMPAIPVDGIQIQQVLTNLIQNAFAALETTVAYRRRLRVTTEMQSEGLACISVTDSGGGLAGQDPNQLFEPFVTSRHDGLGLGLAISRKIVEAHGGTIQAANNADGGATFRFTLPTMSPAVDLPRNSTEEPIHA